MNSNPICHPSPANKMKCSFLDYVQLLMLATLVNGLKPHPPPLCRQENEMLLLWITLNFWWLAGLSDGLKPHPPPLSSQKNEMLIVWLCSTSDDQLGWSMDLNPICHPSPAKKMKCSFLYYIQLLMLATLVNGLKPHPPPLCSQKNEMLLLWITLNFWWLAGLSDGLKPHPPPLSSQKKWNARFWITFISDDLPGWLMNLNLICHPSPTKKMKCSIFDYVQLLMISQAGQLTQSPSATPLQPIKWNAHFWITFNFWWSAGLVNGLKPHPPPLSSQKNEMLIFVLCSLWMNSQASRWTQTPSITPPQPIKWNTHFWITFNFWWSAGLVDGPKPHSPPLSSQKSEMLIFVLHSTSDVGHTGQWTWTSSTTPLQPKNEMLIFGLCSSSDD